jgi:hypothetical protein
MAVSPVMVIGGVALVGWLATMMGGKAEEEREKEADLEIDTEGKADLEIEGEVGQARGATDAAVSTRLISGTIKVNVR